MQYFKTLPKLLKTEKNGNALLLTNLMARASIVSSLLSSPALYYTYDIQDGDTPEIIAHKYYGDMYRYWVVLFANNILDPQWNWPLDSNSFNDYILNKYPTTDVYSTPYDYQKIITKTDSTTGTVTTEVITIDENQYGTLVEGTTSYTLPTGVVTVVTTKKVRSIYDYELDLNESKRNIKLIKSVYVPQLEKEFGSLMA